MLKALFNPIEVNGLQIRNRIAMPAMHLGYCNDGFVSDRLVEFYAERARGGAGLIIVGGCGIDAHGYPSMIRIDDDRYIPGLARLASAVKEHGAAISAQLFQAGRYSHSFLFGLEPVAPSPVPSKLTRYTPRELTEDEVFNMINAFASAALRARQAGFDAVEVIASAGYLVSQFLSPLTNLRKDRFGGDLDGRMTFGLEVARSIREKVGPDFPVFFRVGGSDFMPGGNTNNEIKAFCVELEKAGVDGINVTGGWHETQVPQITMGVPRGAYVYLASQIKQAVNIPVIACNRINDPGLAEAVIFDGLADMVGIARGLIADPELPLKARENRLNDIRRCVGCNQGCLDAVFTSRMVYCLANARAGRESELQPGPAAAAKNVLVIGGGPAGLEAARVAAGRGHRVTLWEKSAALGGQLNLAAVPPGRKEFSSLVNYLAGQMNSLGVRVELNKEATVDNVLEFGADAVVVATGAMPVRPPLPGVSGANVVQAWDVLDSRVNTGRKVVIIGGGAVGCETALFLARKGTISPDALHFLALNRAETWEALTRLATRGIKEVTILEMQRNVGADIGQSTRWTILQELHRFGVKVITGAAADEITPEGVIIKKGDVRELVEADTVVLAVGSKSESSLCEELKEKVKEIYMVGDAVAPRKAMDAIYDGFTAGEVL